MKLSLSESDENLPEESIDFVSVEEVEKDIGTIYILKTDTFTQTGKEIFKIGITSGDIEQRVAQLYTTGVPYRFQTYKTYQTPGFIELERALHSLLAKFRLNASREFFSEEAIPFVDRIVALHGEIKGT